MQLYLLPDRVTYISSCSLSSRMASIPRSTFHSSRSTARRDGATSRRWKPHDAPRQGLLASILVYLHIHSPVDWNDESGFERMDKNGYGILLRLLSCEGYAILLTSLPPPIPSIRKCLLPPVQNLFSVDRNMNDHRDPGMELRVNPLVGS